MLFQLCRELRRRSPGFGVVSSNYPDPVIQFIGREGEEPGEGESTPCSAQGDDK